MHGLYLCGVRRVDLALAELGTDCFHEALAANGLAELQQLVQGFGVEVEELEMLGEPVFVVLEKLRRELFETRDLSASNLESGTTLSRGSMELPPLRRTYRISLVISKSSSGAWGSKSSSGAWEG